LSSIGFDGSEAQRLPPWLSCTVTPWIRMCIFTTTTVQKPNKVFER
jgi:hypothetical protein